MTTDNQTTDPLAAWRRAVSDADCETLRGILKREKYIADWHADHMDYYRKRYDVIIDELWRRDSKDGELA